MVEDADGPQLVSPDVLAWSPSARRSATPRCTRASCIFGGRAGRWRRREPRCTPHSCRSRGRRTARARTNFFVSLCQWGASEKTIAEARRRVLAANDGMPQKVLDPGLTAGACTTPSTRLADPERLAHHGDRKVGLGALRGDVTIDRHRSVSLAKSAVARLRMSPSCSKRLTRLRSCLSSSRSTLVSPS